MEIFKRLYREHGHRFYRDRMTLSEHSARSFYASRRFEAEPNYHTIRLAATFQNIGKLVHKNATYRLAAGFLELNGMPRAVSQLVRGQTLTRRYLYTTDEVYKRQLTPYMLREVVESGGELTEEEVAYFLENAAMADTLIRIALTELTVPLQITKEVDWEELQKLMEKV